MIELEDAFECGYFEVCELRLKEPLVNNVIICFTLGNKANVE